MTVRALVVSGSGINCEEETAAAFRLAGADPQVTPFNAVLAGEVDLRRFGVVVFPGGFSFGDDLGAGKALANRVRYRRLPNGRLFFDELMGFLSEGGFLLGICNGFQVLVKTGLLPNVGGECRQEVSLTRNTSGRFEDRWVHCTTGRRAPTPFLTGIGVIALPVRHGEGRLVITDPAVRQAVIDRRLACLAYCYPDGTVATDYPALPNGSDLSCAGLTDPTGRVFGLMPHPEAHLSLYNHPDWPRIKRREPDRSDEGEGLTLFRNIVHHIESTGS
jgi:phosphoribosylformylglycinamidine (FGAM) synthase-like amidotransferase family enzyme